MKYDSGKFEGGYRLSHIHRTKRFLFVVQAVIVLVFAIYLLVAGGGLSALPFYLSINSFLYFVLIMVLLIIVEGFVFILLEMRFVRSISTKFIITHRSFRTAAVWAVVALIVLLAFWLPLLPNIVADNAKSTGEVMAFAGTVPATFTLFNSDAFGLTEVTTIDFSAQGEAEIFILSEHNYDIFKNDGKAVLGGYRLNLDNYNSAPDLSIDFPNLPHGKFYVLVYSPNDTPVQVDYTITNTVSASMMTYLPFMAILFLVANGIWAAYMFTMNKRFVEGGIYR